MLLHLLRIGHAFLEYRSNGICRRNGVKMRSPIALGSHTSEPCGECSRIRSHVFHELGMLLFDLLRYLVLIRGQAIDGTLDGIKLPLYSHIHIVRRTVVKTVWIVCHVTDDALRPNFREVLAKSNDIGKHGHLGRIRLGAFQESYKRAVFSRFRIVPELLRMKGPFGFVNIDCRSTAHEPAKITVLRPCSNLCDNRAPYRRSACQQVILLVKRNLKLIDAISGFVIRCFKNVLIGFPN